MFSTVHMPINISYLLSYLMYCSLQPTTRLGTKDLLQNKIHAHKKRFSAEAPPSLTAKQTANRNQDMQAVYATCLITTVLQQPWLKFPEGNKNNFRKNSGYFFPLKSIYFLQPISYTLNFLHPVPCLLQVWTVGGFLPGWWVASSRTRGCRCTRRGRSLPPPWPSFKIRTSHKSQTL